MTLKEQKNQQRAAGIAARCAVSEAEREQCRRALARRVTALPEFAAARVIFSYCAARGEADPAEIEAEGRRLGKEIAYPLCGQGGRMEAAVPESPAWLRPGAFGIPAPAPDHSRIVEPREIGLVLVPCTAFDEGCFRVGMGGGFYDRYLPRCCAAFTVALAFEGQKTERAVREAHDVPLDAVATEHALYRAHLNGCHGE